MADRWTNQVVYRYVVYVIREPGHVTLENRIVSRNPSIAFSVSD
jgi:hypothetical protein